jgi:AraC-like DNA-binding protein
MSVQRDAAIVNKIGDSLLRRINGVEDWVRVLRAGEILNSTWEAGQHDYMLVFIDPAKIEDAAHRAGISLPPAVPSSLNLAFEPVRRTLVTLRNELASPGLLSSLYIETLCQQIVLHLVRWLGDERQQAAAANPHGLSSWKQRVVQRFIHDRLMDDDIALSDMAREAGLSETYFCTMFRRTFGTPPYRYILLSRLERAKELMADPGRSLTDIAMESGFGSLSRFSTAFSRLMGMTPSAYRRQQY